MAADGFKPEGLAHPLPVVLTTGKKLNGTQKPEGLTHQSTALNEVR